MKDKIVFFVIGAVLSASAFFAGSYNKEFPDELNVKTIKCKEVFVEDAIWVGRSSGAMIVIDAGGEESTQSVISMISGYGGKDFLGRNVVSQVMLSAKKGVAGINVDSNFPSSNNPESGSISINAWNAGAAILTVKSGDKEEEIKVTKYSD